jgi:probable F420-dependent oxidoreductase
MQQDTSAARSTMTGGSRKFRFGVTGRGTNMRQWREFAVKAEALGYAVLVLPDHFSQQLAPLPALAAAAQVTSTLRFGTLVLDNDFRHPAAMAKEAATVDVLTDGRFELGIGTGSQPADNEHTGIPFDPPGVRVERFVETLAILNAWASHDQVNFAGKHYQLSELPAYPRPVQQPRMPILMGARGPRMLRLAGREADIIGIMASSSETPAEQMAIIRAAAGERFDRIEFNTLYLRVQVDGQPSVADAPPANLTPLLGSPAQIVDRLLAQRESNLVSYVVVVGSAIDAFAPIVRQLAGT